MLLLFIFYKAPQQRLYFLPEPQKQGSFLPIFFPEYFGLILVGLISSSFFSTTSKLFKKVIKSFVNTNKTLLFNISVKQLINLPPFQLDTPFNAILAVWSAKNPFFMPIWRSL